MSEVQQIKPHLDPYDVTASLFGEHYRNATFKSFMAAEDERSQESFAEYNTLIAKGSDTPTYNKEAIKSLQYAKDEVWKFSREAESGNGTRMVLTGGPGRGKTHLCAASAKYLVSKGLKVDVVSGYNFVDAMTSKIKARYNDEERTMGDVIARLTAVDALFIEDVDPETFTETTRRYFSWLFKEVTARNMAVMISSQISIKDLSRDQISKPGPGRPIVGIGKGPMDRLLMPPTHVAQILAPSFRGFLLKTGSDDL